MIHVLIAVTSPALRAGLRALLSADPDLSVCVDAAEVDDGRVNVIVATPEAAAVWNTVADPTGPPLLLLTGDPREVEELRSHIPSGAWGALSPDAPAEALQAAIHALAEGLVVLSPGLGLFSSAGAEHPEGEGDAPNAAVAAARAAQNAAPMPPVPGVDRASLPPEPLTAREMDVLRCLADGLTNKQAALRLGISEHTVKFHVSSIYSKMGVSNRAEAVRAGAKTGIVPL